MARRRPKATTPSTARMMSEEFATHSPTAGTKKLTAPDTVVMNASAAVLLLNILFMVLFLVRDCVVLVLVGSCNYRIVAMIFISKLARFVLFITVSTPFGEVTGKPLDPVWKVTLVESISTPKP